MIFLSHAYADLRLARVLESAFKNSGFECWLDESQIPVGSAFVRQIGEALKKASIFLILESTASQRSYWVSREVEAAKRLRKAGALKANISVILGETKPRREFSPDLKFKYDNKATRRIIDELSLLQIAEFDRVPDTHRINIEDRFRVSEPNNWVGYSEVLRKIDRWWHSDRTGLWITGSTGTGKTSLIQVWISTLKYIGYQKPLNGVCIPVDSRRVEEPIIASSEDQKKRQDPVDRLIQIQLSKEPISLTFQTESALEYHIAVNEYLYSLFGKSNQDSKLLVIDGWERALSEWRDLVNQQIKSGVRVIVVSRESMPSNTPISRSFDEIQLSKLSTKDINILLNRAELDEVSSNLIRQFSDGNPHSIGLILAQLSAASGVFRDL